jgi:hypothetical protein
MAANKHERFHQHAAERNVEGVCTVADDRFGPADKRSKDMPAEFGQTSDNEAFDSIREQGAAPDDLERQARETMRSFGELGGRVRQVLSHASKLWAEAAPAAQVGGRDANLVRPAEEMRGRTLARRWAGLDFLVDPELAQAMGVTALVESAIWQVDLIERGETRSIGVASEAYKGGSPGAPGPILPVWDYSFPAVPEIEAGERRERLPDTALLIACETCNGTGHRSCTACEGKGFVRCPKCHGRARIVCRRCRGRGVIADDVAERRARASKGYWQVQAERIANDASLRLADFAERLRQEHGVPLPPSAQWAPVAPASGVTMPCPECQDGYVPCDCRSGKVICEVCLGSGQAECRVCDATGRVIRHRELVRRFDTRLAEQVVPPELSDVAEWLAHHSLRQVSGEVAWEGAVEDVADRPVPAGIPAALWSAAGELAPMIEQAFGDQHAPEQGERRVLSRRMRLLRVPFTQVSYTFAGQPFEFVAVGNPGTERFWAPTFPARWTSVGRFLRAILRDLSAERAEYPVTATGEVSTLAEYHERRMQQRPHAIEVMGDEVGATRSAAGLTLDAHVPFEEQSSE